MTLTRLAFNPGVPSTMVAEVLALFAWLLPMSFAVLAHTSLRAISADELAMYRYTSDILAYLREDVPIGWSLPLGARYFPDLPISFAAYALSLGDPRAWGAAFALLNQGLIYGALRMLLKAGGVPEPERRLAGALFMAAILFLSAISFQAGANLLRTGYHNTLFAPALIFSGLPMVGARINDRKHLAALVTGFGVLFGVVIHSDPLFVAWSVVPTLAGALVMVVAGGICLRGLLATFVVALIAMALAQASRLGFDALPFLLYKDDRVFALRLRHLGENLARLGRDYAEYGQLSLLLVYFLAAAGGALSLWAMQPERREDLNFRLYILVLSAATAIVVPALMLGAGLLSARYLIWGVAIAALPLALGIADAVGRLWAWSGTAGVAAVILIIGTPFFALQAHKVAVGKTPEDALIVALDAEARSGRIGQAGFASYWVAHKVPLRSDFTVAPIGAQAQPFLLAGNAFAFWDWHSGCPRHRHFSFVVTARKGPQKVLPAAIKARFGAPAGIVPVTGTNFEIWRYPDGTTALDAFYGELVDRLRSRGLSTGALDRCGRPDA
jgi:hypothetical protein